MISKENGSVIEKNSKDEMNAYRALFRTGNGCTTADFRSGFTNQRTKEPFHSKPVSNRLYSLVAKY